MLALAGILAALAVAPGHAEIAFESDAGIWSSRADGSERQLVVAPTTRGETLSEPVWSPDGTTLADVRTQEGEGTQLMLSGAGGTRAFTPVRRNSSDHSPAWSPDGTAVALMRFTRMGERLTTQIVTQAIAGGTERAVVSVRLDRRLSSVAEPAWSPDGTRIAYTHNSLDRGSYFRHAVRTVAATGGDSRLLLRQAHSAVWSPDGGRLAFASIRDRNRPNGDADEVYSVAADGSCLTWVTNGTPDSRAATWRPASGTRFDPGSCDPDTRSPRVEPATPKPMRDRQWLGPRHGPLLLSFVDDLPPDIRRTGYLSYNDCARFEPERCGSLPLDLRTEAACRPVAFHGLTERGVRFERRRGALVALSDGNALVMSGHATTTIYYASGSQLSRVLRRLRPLDAAKPPHRLEPPRVRRELGRALERTARTYARLGTIEATARARGISRTRARGHLRLQRALRSFGPYRYSSCNDGSR